MAVMSGNMSLLKKAEGYEEKAHLHKQIVIMTEKMKYKKCLNI